MQVKGDSGQLVPLAELGRWETARVDQMIYHKNLQRVAYVFAETAGRPPADVVVDVLADRDATPPADRARSRHVGNGWMADTAPRPVDKRTFFSNGSGIAWGVPAGFTVDFAGEGEWKITLDVFRDLGLAFGAAMIAHLHPAGRPDRLVRHPAGRHAGHPADDPGRHARLLAAQRRRAPSRSAAILDPVYFTATGMIGMIALAGIVTRDSIILVDFIHLSLARGRSLFDAIMESRVVRLRPILLTAGAAMLGAVPIIIDPIFSGLAWSLIFGLFASTLFTLFVIPVAYWLLYANKPGHGLPQSAMEQEDRTSQSAAADDECEYCSAGI